MYAAIDVCMSTHWLLIAEYEGCGRAGAYPNLYK